MFAMYLSYIPIVSKINSYRVVVIISNASLCIHRVEEQVIVTTLSWDMNADDRRVEDTILCEIHHKGVRDRNFL